MRIGLGDFVTEDLVSDDATGLSDDSEQQGESPCSQEKRVSPRYVRCYLLFSSLFEDYQNRKGMNL